VGGRLVMAATLEALAARGADLTLVAPTAGQPDARGPAGVRTILVDAQPRPWLRAGAASVQSGHPLSIERHAHAAIAAQIAELVQRDTFDIVHIEQPQAWRSAEPARRSRAATVLRAQNVESAMWEAASRRPVTATPAAAALRPLWSAALRTEARRMRRFEASIVAAADVTIALSSADAAQLSALSPSARVLIVPPPAPAPPLASESALASSLASSPDAMLDGEPAFVWMGSAGWSPNAEAVRWLLDEIWPAVASRLPRAHLHVFGASDSRARGRGRHRSSSGDAANANAHDAAMTWHVAPSDSRAAFAAGAILLLPLTIAAGVRMRLLEAWASHMPVIASPAAVAGLETADGDDVLIAADASAFSEAAVRLASDAPLRARLAAGGRATIARRHDPAIIAEAMLAAYREAISRRLAREGGVRSGFREAHDKRDKRSEPAKSGLEKSGSEESRPEESGVISESLADA
jgi:glycosyltransferase involved in cell wall biosynthesis